MFSTRITAASTMMPKSTAPTDKQVGVLVVQHQNDDAEEQREWNVGADDDRAAQVAEKYPLNDKDQQAAEDQVVQHRAAS